MNSHENTCNSPTKETSEHSAQDFLTLGRSDVQMPGRPAAWTSPSPFSNFCGPRGRGLPAGAVMPRNRRAGRSPGPPPQQPQKLRKTNFLFRKISPKKFSRRRNMKCWESFETRFYKFSRRSEPSLKRKRQGAEKSV